MNTWIFEEYLGLPSMLYRLQKANRRRSGVIREKIQYGAEKHQYILIMRPAESCCTRRNAVYFIHGGGWALGSPAAFAFAGSFFAGLGFNTILGGYRHAPFYKYPTQLVDVCSGLKAGMHALEKQGCKSESVIVAGESAGAQLAGLLVLDEENLAEQQLEQGLFSGLIIISGPMDFASCNARQIRLGLRIFLDSRRDYYKADPTKYVKNSFRLPVLCIHGCRDPIVDIQSSRSFYEKVSRESEADSRFVAVPGKHHLDLLDMFLERNDAAGILESFVNNIEKM